MLGWAVDVAQWFQEQGAKGQLPVVSLPAPAFAAAPQEGKALPVSSRYEVPRTMAEAVPIIRQGLQELTGYAFRVEVGASGTEIGVRPPEDRFCFRRAELQACCECCEDEARWKKAREIEGDPEEVLVSYYALAQNEREPGAAPTRDPRWQPTAQRLLSTRAARSLLDQTRQDPRLAAILAGTQRGRAMLYSSRVTVDPPEYETVLAIWTGADQIELWRVNAEGCLETSHQGHLTGTAAKAIEELRAERLERGLLHCLACGYALGFRRECLHCEQAWDRWHAKEKR